MERTDTFPRSKERDEAMTFWLLPEQFRKKYDWPEVWMRVAIYYEQSDRELEFEKQFDEQLRHVIGEGALFKLSDNKLKAGIEICTEIIRRNEGSKNLPHATYIGVFNSILQNRNVTTSGNDNPKLTYLILFLAIVTVSASIVNVFATLAR